MSAPWWSPASSLLWPDLEQPLRLCSLLGVAAHTSHLPPGAQWACQHCRHGEAPPARAQRAHHVSDLQRPSIPRVDPAVCLSTAVSARPPRVRFSSGRLRFLGCELGRLLGSGRTRFGRRFFPVVGDDTRRCCGCCGRRRRGATATSSTTSGAGALAWADGISAVADGAGGAVAVAVDTVWWPRGNDCRRGAIH